MKKKIQRPKFIPPVNIFAGGYEPGVSPNNPINGASYTNINPGLISTNTGANKVFNPLQPLNMNFPKQQGVTSAGNNPYTTQDRWTDPKNGSDTDLNQWKEDNNTALPQTFDGKQETVMDERVNLSSDKIGTSDVLTTVGNVYGLYDKANKALQATNAVSNATTALSAGAETLGTAAELGGIGAEGLTASSAAASTWSTAASAVGNIAGKIAAPLAIAAGAYGLGSGIYNDFQIPTIEDAKFDTGFTDKSQMLQANANSANRTFNTKIKRTSEGGAAGKGALDGAGIGAGIGSFIGPVGTAIGAGIGALVGGFGRWITSAAGNRKKRREERRARQKASQYYTIYGESQNDLINGNMAQYQLSNQAGYGGNMRGIESILAKNSNNIFANGGNFSNGINIVGAGGTHETNPNGGVFIGMGENGLPNLIEENEVKWGDYIFSDRLTLPKNVKDFKLPKFLAGQSFAKASEALSKESEERELNSISKRGQEVMLGRLGQAQEYTRQLKEEKEKPMATQYKYGGLVNEFKKGGRSKYKNPYITSSLRNPFDTEWLDELGYTLPEEPEEPEVQVLKEDIKPPSKSSLNTEGLTDFSPTFNVKGDKKEEKKEDKKDTKKKKSWEEYLSYAAPLANVGLAISDFNQKPDSINLSRIQAPKIGETLQYNPMDSDYLLNRTAQEASANRSAILDTAGGNAAIARAGLLQANRNSQNAIGDALFRTNEVNADKREKVAAFNRGTSQFNAENEFKARMFNAANSDKEVEYRKQSEAARRNAIRQDIAGLGTTISQIGTESRWKNIAPNLSGGYNSKGEYVGYGNTGAFGGKIYKRKIK